MSLLPRLQRILRESPAILDKPTRTPQEIADKHGVPLADIEAQLKKGIAVEKEHTSDEAIARKIALDHLSEMPDYYDKLAKVEETVARVPGRLPERGMMPSPFPVTNYHIPLHQNFVNAPVRRVSLHNLHATQRTVDADNVRRFIDDPTLGGKPIVANLDGTLTIVDGHHRLTAAKLRGETYALAHVVEDAPAMAAGHGAIAGIGVGSKGEPGVMLPRKKRVDEAAADTFGNADVFDVDMDLVMNVRDPKKNWERYSKYVGIDEVGEDIRAHARKHWKRDIILRDSKTGVMRFLRRRQPRVVK